MITNITSIAYRIGDKLFQLFCPQDATTAELKEISSMIIAQMVEIEKKAAEEKVKNQSEEVVEPEVICQ